MSSFIKGLGLDLFDFKGKLIAISEEHYADASFCLSCFMWQALSNPDTAVCLLTIRHSLRHYYHVGMRLGYNLSSSYGTRFIGLDAVDVREAHIKHGKESEFSPKTVFGLLHKKIALLKNQQKNVFVVIDSLSDFLNLGASPKEVMTFVHYIGVCFPDDTTLVISSHYHEDDEDQVKLKNALLYISQLRLTVKSLETGFSKDVTGCIEISKPNTECVEGWSKPSMYHYKTKDRSVNVFLPGNITFSY